MTRPICLPCSVKPMPELLLINPNTSQSVTALLQIHATRAAQAAGVPLRLTCTTARFGAPYIACEASYAVAGHATLDAWAHALAEQPAGFDAMLIGCFGDPGLMALAESSPVPVSGLAQAAFTLAAAQGRFAVVTGGARWRPMLERLAAQLGFAGQLAAIHTVSQSGAELAANPAAARVLLAQACVDVVQRTGASTVILGGAGLAGMAQDIQHAVPVQVIDSVVAGVQHVLSLMTSRPGLPSGEGAASPFDFCWNGVSPALTRLGRSA
jgi:allantoin racemase